MKKIGLFYGTTTTKTASIAKKIKEAFGSDKVDLVSVEDAWKKDFESYDNIIVGVATWFDGELPNHWDEVRPELEALNLKGKKVAIFGLGDQVRYPENFVGFTSIDGFNFEMSRAIRDHIFVGLAIDKENQSKQTNDRIKNWVEQLKKEFD